MINCLVHNTLKWHFSEVIYWVGVSADSGSAVTFDVEHTTQLSLQQQGIEAVILRKNETSA